MMFPEATRAWRRLKLLLAEVLVLTITKGEHSHGHQDRAMETADAIKEFRELYYPKVAR